MYSTEIMEFVVSSSEKVEGEVPVVAAIAVGLDVLTICTNQVERRNKVWAHAEFLAIQKACDILDTKYLDKASMYVNLEPCAFCASALEKVRINEIFFGAYDEKCGAIVHGIRLFDQSMIKPKIIGGIQERRCSEIIRNFFINIRKERKNE